MGEKMDQQLKEIKKHVQLAINKKEFNEGLAILENFPDDFHEIEILRQEIEDRRTQEVDLLLRNYEEAFKQKDWAKAEPLIQKAKELNSQDSKVRAAEQLFQQAKYTFRKEEKLFENIHTAQKLLMKKVKTIGDIDRAISLLEEVASNEPDNLDADSLLNKAHQMRSEYLQSIGQVATLEQAEDFEEALKEIKNSIAKGYAEHNGENIFDVRGRLEKQVQEFADQKAAKYLKKAEEELKENPRLSMKYIEIGLGLPSIPKIRREALEEVKIKVELTLEKYQKVEEQIKKASELMNVQEYKKSITVLNDCLAQLPFHQEAKSYLNLAEQNLRNQILKEARLTIARIQGGFFKSNYRESREKLFSLLNKLDFSSEESHSLQNQCQEILEKINIEIKLESQLEETVKRAQLALKNNDLEGAELEITNLDKRNKEKAEIKQILTELNKRKKVEDALAEIRKAYEEGRLETSRELISDLRKRNNKNQEVEELYNKIESDISYNKGIELFDQGLIKEARQTFSQVIDLDFCFKDEAREYLEKIDQLRHFDKKAEEALNSAQRQFQNQQYEEAFVLLKDYDSQPSSFKVEIQELRFNCRKKWRAQLVEQIKGFMEANSFNTMEEAILHLRSIQNAEDASFINKASKKLLIHQAKLYSEQKNWTRAHESWEEAQKYDAMDHYIKEGIRKSLKQKAFQDISNAESEKEVAQILEEVIEYDTSALSELDFKIEDRLYHSFILTEDFNKALSLTGKRISQNSKFGKRAKIIRELCTKLSNSKEKFQRGAYKESLGILKKCQEAYLEFPGTLGELYQKRSKKTIEILSEEIRELENNAESEVVIINKYKELLKFDPHIKDAKERLKQLQENFKLRISDRIQEAIRMRDDENTPKEEIDLLINEMNEMLTLAKAGQKTKIKLHLNKIREKSQTLSTLEKKLIQLEGLLSQAKETGNFRDLDQELHEVVNIASHKNRRFKKITYEIQEIKERREKCIKLADQLDQAFKEKDFNHIEALCREIKRLDPDDEYRIQFNRLRYEEPLLNIEISFDELKDWARERRRNFEVISHWYEGKNINTKDYEEQELKLRNIDENDILCYEKLGDGLIELSDEYLSRSKGLINSPESPLSQKAREIVTKASQKEKKLREKWQNLKKEGENILQNKEKVAEIVEEAALLINQDKYLPAAPVVEEGLSISPNHLILIHFRNMIKGKKR
jgi:hypothetical protein